MTASSRLLSQMHCTDVPQTLSNSASALAPSLSRALSGNRIPGLDFLRMAAVLLVLADHSGAVLLGTSVGANGALGVELFFVISGFMVSGSYIARANLADFMTARLLRIVPAFLFVLVASALILGPLFATPRTATVSFEMGFAPFMGHSSTALFIYSAVYFALVMGLSLFPGKLIDNIGKIEI